MRPINLVPLEDRRGERTPLRAGPLAYVLVAALLMAFIGVYLMVSAGNTISDRESELAALEDQLSASQARATALQSFAEFASLEQSRTQTVSDLARSRFDWERVMRELALVIPSGVSLSSLKGAVSPDAGGEAGTGSGGQIAGPSMTMTGCGPEHQTIAEFVAALRDIDGVTRVGLTNSTENGSTGATETSGTSTSTSGSGASCASDGASFELTVAFDGVQVDPASGAVAPEEPAPVPGEESGVAEAQAEQEASRGSAESAAEEGREAVDSYVPGA